MSIMNLTLPNLVGYAVVFWLLIQSVAHKFEFRDKSGALESGERQFSHHIESALRSGGSIHRSLVERFRTCHPSATVLACMMEEPQLAHDELALNTWISSAVDEQIGPLRARMESIHAAAPAIGLLGTILGFLIATWTYSGSLDQGQMMSSVALAMVTTLVAGIATLIERSTLDKLDSLEDGLVLRAQKTAARARYRLSTRPAVGNSLQNQRIEHRLLHEDSHPNYRKLTPYPTGSRQPVIQEGGNNHETDTKTSQRA